MQRRTWMKLGMASAAALAVAGLGVGLTTPAGLKAGRLSPPAREVVVAVARAVLDDRLPIDPAARAKALQAHADDFEKTVAAFPPSVQGEIAELLMVLGTGVGRLALAGVRRGWADASAEEIQAGLQAMRESSLSLRAQAYHALRDLTHAAHYAQPEHWKDLRYPGPQTL